LKLAATCKSKKFLEASFVAESWVVPAGMFCEAPGGIDDSNDGGSAGETGKGEIGITRAALTARGSGEAAGVFAFVEGGLFFAPSDESILEERPGGLPASPPVRPRASRTTAAKAGGPLESVVLARAACVLA